jgi:XTP/dITP diphosphohydrolase
MQKINIPYVTTNHGKFKDIENFLKNHPTIPVSITQKPVETTEIQGDNQKEITTHKALEAWNILKRPLLVEDAGIFFENYHNFPGTFSKWIFKSLGREHITKLFQPGDRAYFQLTLCYIDGTESLHFFEGKCSGSLIAPPEKINVALPYQTFFIPDGAAKTYQELSDAGEKEPFAFRAHAIKKFLEWYVAHKINQ